MPRVSITGINTYYEVHGHEVHGQGKPLVLVHHGLGSTKMWEKLLPAAAASYRVILYDRRGFGRSDPGENFRDYYLSEQYIQNSVTELSALLEYLHIKDGIYLVGQCEGGVVAFSYAAQNPGAVKAVAVSSTLCYSKAKMTEYLAGKMIPSFEEIDREFRETFVSWHGETHAPKLFSLFMEFGGAYGSGVFDLRETLREVRCPSLVLYPDRSRLFEVEQGALMYRSLPAGELAVLPDCGHNTYAEQPEEYQRIMLSFLARHR
jgi:pimeloyl-ACP methyl ester carboxylesterase